MKKCKKKNKNKKDSEAKDSTQDGSKISKPSVIPIVEVKPLRCSFNPSFEAHRDSLAQAIATKMRNFIKMS
ncbi:unnamed protein product [Dovyalis caffra]|uniref:Uncharacterized protein n=1 Tax=Dovyalis caffra TaxID=77055 RepID=A0AAV1RQ67_9ROSI|nr:unnamed protein product [Dovyalis caffra]